MTDDDLLDAISGVLPPMMAALEALNHVARHLHPPNLAALAKAVVDKQEPVAAGLKRFAATEFPADLGAFKTQVQQAGECVLRACEGLQAAAGSQDAMPAYRALGQRTRAMEALYPIANVLPPVSRFFLEADCREDEALRAKLHAADASRSDVGIIHADNERAIRGGFSLYVPEYYDAEHAWPLIVALHGGSGHGRDFLWTWLIEARSRGAILLSPTAQDGTWALMGRDIDSPNLAALVERIGQRWNLDRQRLLLTGMSDGGTFCYVSGLREDSPFTHLAPSSASFHPLLLAATSKERLQGLPIYLMHGALDWMFPVQMAREASAALSAAGAAVHYREIADLSHTWPRDENAGIMDWLMADGR